MMNVDLIGLATRIIELRNSKPDTLTSEQLSDVLLLADKFFDAVVEVTLATFKFQAVHDKGHGMKVFRDPSLTLQKAASRVRGDRLVKLTAICEQQKSISTRRLMKLVDELRDSDRMDGLHFKALSDWLRKKGTE